MANHTTSVCISFFRNRRYTTKKRPTIVDSAQNSDVALFVVDGKTEHKPLIVHYYLSYDNLAYIPTYSKLYFNVEKMWKLICNLIVENTYIFQKIPTIQLTQNVPRIERTKFHWQSNAPFFYRFQNILGWSKLFVPEILLIYILCGFQTHSARPKDDFHSVILVFVPAQTFWSSTKCNSTFGLAQNIWTSTKHFGTCRRTRH